MNDNSVYLENGFKDRKEYLQSLADEYDVDLEIVGAIADLLGPNEDFDGLVSMVQDKGSFY